MDIGSIQALWEENENNSPCLKESIPWHELIVSPSWEDRGISFLPHREPRPGAVAKVLGFLSWPPAFSPTFLPSSLSPGTDHHGPLENLTAFAVIPLAGTMETKSQHYLTGSLSFHSRECSWAAPLSFQSHRKPLWWAEVDPITRGRPGPKSASVYCTLGVLKLLGNILTNQSPPSSEMLSLLRARPLPWGESILLLLSRVNLFL